MGLFRMMESVKEALNSAKVHMAIIPGGCTKHIQAPNVSWNKPFKAYITEKYGQWLAAGLHEFTETGNIKAAPRRKIVQWILESWSHRSKEMISKSVKVCALNLPTDGSADDQIHCFKEGTTCEAGAEKLKTQLAIVASEELDDTNPFSLINQVDMEAAAHPFHLLDDDEESEEELDIM